MIVVDTWLDLLSLSYGVFGYGVGREKRMHMRWLSPPFKTGRIYYHNEAASGVCQEKVSWFIKEVEGDSGASISSSPTEGFYHGNDTVSRHGLGGESCPIDTLGYNAE
jgi:hypothetical protein